MRPPPSFLTICMASKLPDFSNAEWRQQGPCAESAVLSSEFFEQCLRDPVCVCVCRQSRSKLPN